MKRLFYVTQTIDDAKKISDEVHALGIDDHHFYVLSRDKHGLRTHHLHGGSRLGKTEILSANKRASFFALIALLVVGNSIAFSVDAINQNVFYIILAALCIFLVARFIALIACKSFDNYFKGVFDEHMDHGRAVIVIDVKRSQAKRIEKQLEKHEQASFIADSSNIASPIPQ